MSYTRSITGWSAVLALTGLVQAAEKFDPSAEALKHIASLKVQTGDWPSWGGTPYRNNTPASKNIPETWDLDTGENVLWVADLGSQTYGNPVIANGKVYVGTNNGNGYIKRFPSNVDLGCLVCIDEKTGDFLWQASSPKLPSGRVHDWPQQGVCSTVYCEDSRVWYVTSRGEVTCLDANGFHDGKNDGAFQAEPSDDKYEADVLWRLDMMGELGVSQHNMCSCSVTAMGDYLFVDTGNGVDESHINIPAPNAPSHLCINKNTGKVLWTDNTPGVNVLHGQWSSPVYFVDATGQAQIVFGSGDGWMYSFDPQGDGKGKPKLLWKFDGNPKTSLYLLGGRATRNHFIGTPIFYDGYVYCAVGEDPEHGEGVGHLYCLDPTKRGDISLELAMGADGKELAPRRLQNVDEKKGEKAVANPNSGVIFHYDAFDRDGDKKVEFEETMHRTIGSCAIKDDLLYIADFSGLVHCLDAKKLSAPGKPTVYWTHDMFAASWGSPLIVDGKVFIGDEDGDITIFELSKELNILGEINMINAIYSTPVAANDTLFISNKSNLFAIKKGAKLEGGFKPTARASSGDGE